MTQGYACLQVRIDGSVAHIRLVRPALHNRFDEALHTEFPDALRAISEVPDLAALILSAEGPSFSAGGDLEMMLRANADPALRDRLISEGRAIIWGMLDLACPVIAAVQGPAIGLGATILACSDIVVAWRGAKIADPHVLLGLVAGDGGILGWSQSVGVMRAKRYLLTGDRITGEQAHAMGLVTDLVDSPDEVFPAAEKIAGRIAELPRVGVRGTKLAFAKHTRETYGAAFEHALQLEMDALASDEVREAVLRAVRR